MAGLFLVFMDDLFRNFSVLVLGKVFGEVYLIRLRLVGFPLAVGTWHDDSLVFELSSQLGVFLLINMD